MKTQKKDFNQNAGEPIKRNPEIDEDDDLDFEETELMESEDVEDDVDDFEVPIDDLEPFNDFDEEDDLDDF